MIIIAGWLAVAPDDRAAYLDSCAEAVRLAREAPGCLEYALGADLLDPGRITVYERWESDADLERFRGSGPSDEQTARILEASVARYRISAVEAP
ncbi:MULTISPECIES: antibiotic biosynthesis monooxygenase family protein [unclassified Amycolatopsis]|uniref:putative quinol monooxygenase n=1 Tax=unclassified Amycolatopsis TaxID=2618356 RepID=UPI0028756CB2|nr:MULTISPECIES: antibiotic biosynthesis monooxygenase family protein [unclassified Amycolatopsis]MDS0136388.1 antibiotic biosynthesis monooxygenase [Amycolatopsis sp. 505]MDS0145903.1 antibiotic biosynthesis monooxygenase [Amycolatopsis sp. CM201R]